MLFSKDNTCFVTERGHLMLGAVGMSHGEELDTYILVNLEDLSAFYKGESVAERAPFAHDTKWKPKKVSYDKDTGTYELTDPMHQVTINDRKKYVTGKVNGTLTKEDFLKLSRESVKEAYFELSMEPISSLRNSKGMKKYSASLKKWEEFCKDKYDKNQIMLEANRSYYSAIPEGVIYGKI